MIAERLPPSSKPRSGSAIRDSSFTVALLLDPCNLSQCLTTPVLPSTHDTARSRIFSTAMAHATSLTGTPGIKLDAKCANVSHKRKKDCGCLRFIGPAHGKVVRGVNTPLTPWGRIEVMYQVRTCFFKMLDCGQLTSMIFTVLERAHRPSPSKLSFSPFR
jgi:hypothetical protein